MAYALSTTKLKSYARCPKAYYFRYECGLTERNAFASAALGIALHGRERKKSVENVENWLSSTNGFLGFYAEYRR